MVLLTTTPQILAAISHLSQSDRSSLDTLPTKSGAPIEHKTIILLSRLLRSSPGPDKITTSTSSQVSSNEFSLNDLLRGAHVYTPPPPAKPAPSPEYTALMTRLRREEEKREYTRLTSGSTQSKNLLTFLPSKTTLDEESDGSDDISPSLVLNILLSVVLCAVAAFQMTRWWKNDGVRVLLSLAVGIIVGVAEVGLYAIYLRKVRLSKEKERNKMEKKSFVGEFKLDSEDSHQDQNEKDTRSAYAAAGHTGGVSGDKEIEDTELIWGRGVHGGMRKRVRDKWEKQQQSNHKDES